MIYLIPVLAQAIASTSLEEVFRDFQPELVTALPLNDATFVAILVKNEFFVGDQIATMEAKNTAADKASYFLSDVICHDIEKHFIKLLNLMEAYGSDLEPLAHNIKKTLGIGKYDSDHIKIVYLFVKVIPRV